MTPEDSGGHIRKCSDWKLRAGFRALYRTQLARQETGYPYLLESFPERYSLGGADDRTGAGVHGKVRIREPAYVVWLHEDIDRRHMHIVSVRINEKGEKIDHNREGIRAQNICREMEVKYGLHPTLGEHGERELLSLKKWTMRKVM